MADGNFKADHVRAKTPSNDIWLSEGGGMAPDRDEYFNFLKTAMETRTVSSLPLATAGMMLNYLPDTTAGLHHRKQPVKTHSGPSPIRSLPPLLVTSPAWSALPVLGMDAMPRMHL